MAYLQDIRRYCGSCAQLAHFELLDTHNVSHGYFCGPCSQAALNRLNDRDLARIKKELDTKPQPR